MEEVNNFNNKRNFNSVYLITLQLFEDVPLILQQMNVKMEIAKHVLQAASKMDVIQALEIELQATFMQSLYFCVSLSFFNLKKFNLILKMLNFTNF